MTEAPHVVSTGGGTGIELSTAHLLVESGWQ